MKSSFQVTFLASTLLLGAAFLGCGGSKPKPGPGEPNETCADNTDCPDSEFFFCNQSTQKCEPACTSKADCTKEVRGEYALDFCDNNPLGCQCDQSTCVTSRCSADVDCGGTLVCREGACVAAPAAAVVTKCQITPDYVTAKKGTTVKFYVSTWQDNKPVVLQSGTQWSGDATAELTGTPTALSADYKLNAETTAGAKPSVQVKVGSATCSASVLVLSDSVVPSGHIRATVMDELTGRPLKGVQVWVNQADTGVSRGAAVLTNDNGVADVTVSAGSGAGANSVSVSAGHMEYNYLTIVGYDMATGSRDISLVLRRNQTDKYGGFSGTLEGLPATANLQMGIAGMSIAGSPIDLSFTQLLGPSQYRDINIAETINVKGVPLPGGVFLKLSDNNIKTDILGLGLAGSCDNAAQTAAGTCGTRSAWGLVGDVPISEIAETATQFSNGLDNVNFGNVLGKLIPVFRRFNSTVARDVSFTLKQTPPFDDDNDPNFSDTAHFTKQNLGAQNTPQAFMPLAFNFVVSAPTLPKFKNQPADGVVVLGGTVVRGRGLIPLGLGAGVDTNGDGKTDVQSGLSSQGLLSLRMAPNHGGLESSDYALMALTSSLAPRNDANAGVPTAGVLQWLPENRLPFDPTGNNQIAIAEPFLSFPENAVYNFEGTTQSFGTTSVAPRTFKFKTKPAIEDSAVSLYRVIFENTAKRRWMVMGAPAAVTSAAGIRVPAVPSAPAGAQALEDRTFGTLGAKPTRASRIIQAIRLRARPTDTALLTLGQLAENNGTNADRLLDLTSAFSAIDNGRAEISWLTPTTVDSRISAGAQLKFKVKNFKIGTGAEDEGVARVTFSGGGAACENQTVTATTDTSNGRQELQVALPSGCTGTVRITATLYNKTNTAEIAPYVATQVTGTVQ